jgi:processive 1,2-diacylglycerol beta-glucosyltransferase
MLDKVLVLSASAGAGHVRAAQAIERALVMVIVNPIPGQEERNADHLLEEGVATRCNNLPVLPDKIERLLADPARLAAMRANVRRLARPRAAGAIVDALQAAGP